jgi:hypothetical protein
MIFKAEAGKSGFIRSAIAPVNDRRAARFGILDALELLTLVIGIVLVMRYFLR